jgi:adenylate cyclase
VDELRELCADAGDNASLAVGLTALALQHGNRGHYRESIRLASEIMAMLESVGDPTSTIGATTAVASIRHEAGHSADVLQWSQTVIDRASAGTGECDARTQRSPLIALALIFRGIARWWLGHDGWRQDLDDAVALAPRTDPITHPSVVSWKYLAAIPHGVLRPDDAAVRELEAALSVAEASGEDTSVANLKNTLGRVLVERESAAERQRGLALLTEVRELCVRLEFFLINLPVLEFYAARERADVGDLDGSLPLMRQAVDQFAREGQVVQGIWGSAVLAQTLLKRGATADVSEAQGVVDTLAKLPDDVSGVVRDIWLLRLGALLARARDDETAYRDYRDRYRTMSFSLGFEGHMQWAEAMP